MSLPKARRGRLDPRVNMPSKQTSLLPVRPTLLVSGRGSKPGEAIHVGASRPCRSRVAVAGAAGSPSGPGLDHRPQAGGMHRGREVPEDERLLLAGRPAGPGAGVFPTGGRAAELVLRGDEVGRPLPRRGSSQAQEATDREEGPLLRERLRPEVRGEPDG